MAEFNRLCRESVTAYVDDWNRMTERIGMWLDLDDPYMTMTDEYIESVWWILADFAKQGLLYEGYKVVPYCPRCGTALSSHEVASGYQMVTDPSVYVRFPLVTGPATPAPELAADGRPVSLLVWTTTPWTLVSNVAAAVGADIQYAKARTRGDHSGDPSRRDSARSPLPASVRLRHSRQTRLAGHCRRFRGHR